MFEDVSERRYTVSTFEWCRCELEKDPKRGVRNMKDQMKTSWKVPLTIIS